MAFFDLPLAELQHYQPPHTRRNDFETFWQETLAQSTGQPLDIHQEPLDLPYRGAQLTRLSYAGWNGATIVGTYAIPAGVGPFPALAMYHGYSSSRPDPFDLLSWTSQGYAVLAVDVRGQSGESTDASSYPGGHAPGYLTLGMHDPAYYYYRGVYIDALRAVAVLAAMPEVDAARVGITGGSQGGALTLATAALSTMYPRLKDSGVQVRAAVAEIPFLCHFERAATLVDSEPYQEIARYCRRSGVDAARVFATLSYFDCMNLAGFIAAPTLVTAGLMDMVCPPSTIFAAYNAIQAPKYMVVAPFGEHDTFPGVPEARFRWFAGHMGQA